MAIPHCATIQLEFQFLIQLLTQNHSVNIKVHTKHNLYLVCDFNENIISASFLHSPLLSYF